jgi:hypothetical protein
MLTTVRVVVAVSLALAGLAGAAGPARGFQIDTTVTAGCHERITDAARRAAGWPRQAPALTEDDRRAIADLPFTAPTAIAEPWTLALLIGVRSNDLRDNPPTDLAALVHIHNDPDDQPAHCIRRAEHDGPAGDVLALAACRAFIEGELTAGGWFAPEVDHAVREPVAVYLAFRGRLELALPRAAYRLGRAVHALEDGFTHTLRNPGDDRVRSVLNWIDVADPDDYQVERDGLGHIGWVDDCRRDEARVVQGVTAAEAAVTELMVALAAPTAAARSAGVAVALDRALALEPGCTAANRYCDAVELDDPTTGGCAAGGGGGGAVLALAVLGGWWRRRRGAGGLAVEGTRRSTIRPTLGGLLGLTLLVGLALRAAPAVAEPFAPGLHLHGGGGAALDRGALAIGGGAHWRWASGAVAGATVEWNPWISLDVGRAAPGSINAYAVVGYSWFTTARFEVHSHGKLGASAILFELVGVDRGQIGAYVGASLLGASVRLRDDLALTIDPSDFAMPAPQLTGFPFYYRQYRISVGLTWRP